MTNESGKLILKRASASRPSGERSNLCSIGWYESFLRRLDKGCRLPPKTDQD